MAHESISVSEVIPAAPEQIYAAWLDTAAHSAFTGDEATVEPFVGGRHSSFGGYAEGTTLELLPGQRIVQTWRSKDFPDGTPDSRIEVTLEQTMGGTMVTILHSEIPAGQTEQLRDGWVKYYLQALKAYFGADEDEGGAGDEEETAVDASADGVSGMAAAAPTDDDDDDTGSDVPTVTEDLPKPAKAPTRAAARKPPAMKASAKAKPKVQARAKAKPAAEAKARAKAKPARATKKVVKAKAKAAKSAKRKPAPRKEAAAKGRRPAKQSGRKPAKRAGKKPAKKKR